MMPVRENAHPVGASLLDPQWTQAVPADRPTILVADGLLGFLSEAEVTNLLRSITDHFTAGDLVTNAYTRFSARLTGHYVASVRSEEHTSELQSRGHLVCRLLLEKENDRRSL